jgi:hypothetical protein
MTHHHEPHRANSRVVGLRLRAGEFGSSQGTAQICLPQLEPFDGRWFEIVFSGLSLRRQSSVL